ncbi:hypothetical protein LK994_05065 [Ferruginibacter lapsinanis]|uniref:hypothetical protein n=1 Tax=Ferruginibacter lapsinanis TaxID=563172 RepID=UPI001E3CEF87|nr:hypothetical protein [Ferruginibacter lapsinanis]UEG50845.1 hypothetical protein LK994_05065 [Ferruginibacter lapsinanis]
MLIQILPIRSVVKYFFIDNVITEEILHADKGATKNFRFIDEDHKCLPSDWYLTPQLSATVNTILFHFDEMLPASYPADVQTPPPNRA